MHQKHTKEEKENLFTLSNLIRSFGRVGVEMLNTTIKTKVINRKELSPLLLFRQSLEMADALSVLFEQGVLMPLSP